MQTSRGKIDMVDKKVADLGGFIDYLKSTPEDSWAVDVIRTKTGENCVLGHLIDYVYGKNYKGNIMPAWDLFGEIWATEYMYYPVNDGNSPGWMNYKYHQPTPKQRIIAYLTNLKDGREKTTYQCMEEDYKRYSNTPPKQEVEE